MPNSHFLQDVIILESINMNNKIKQKCLNEITDELYDLYKKMRNKRQS